MHTMARLAGVPAQRGHLSTRMLVPPVMVFMASALANNVRWLGAEARTTGQQRCRAGGVEEGLMGSRDPDWLVSVGGDELARP